MAKKKTGDSRKLLLITAGQLFAQQGYDGVSTRMITEQAGLKLSSIHYHFGTKENLYIESFSYAKKQGVRSSFTDVMAENPELAHSPEGLAEIIKSTIFRRYHEYFNPSRPIWEIQLLVREIVNPSSALPVLAEKLFKPEIEASDSFFRMVKPEASDMEAAVWSDMFHSQLLFYTMARIPMELIRGEGVLSQEFLRTAARNLSRAMILLLGLPLPKDL